MISNRCRWLLAGVAASMAACAYGQQGYGYGNGYGYGQDAYGYAGRERIRCESQDERTRYCTADIRGGVRLVEQLSNSDCIEGRSWGWDARGIWVSRGCRAEFEVAGGGGYGYGNDNGYYDPGRGDYGRGRVIRCESTSSRTVYCDADTRYGVRLLTQHSRSECIEGRTWGTTSRGVWVSRGCRAQFQVGGDSRYGYGDTYGYGDRYGNGDRYGYGDRYGQDDRYGYGDPYANGAGYGRRLRCESQDGRYEFCRVGGSVRQAQIVRQMSQSQCRYNVSWGYRSDGVWVDRGCRAEFSIY
jgi:hypothetical protein